MRLANYVCVDFLVQTWKLSCLHVQTAMNLPCRIARQAPPRVGHAVQMELQKAVKYSMMCLRESSGDVKSATSTFVVHAITQELQNGEKVMSERRRAKGLSKWVAYSGLAETSLSKNLCFQGEGTAPWKYNALKCTTWLDTN